METKTGKSGLQIPLQIPEKKAQLNMDLESIKKWRAELPMADTGACAKKIFLALSELNQTSLTAEKRLAILELLRPPLQLIEQTLKKHYLNQITPLTKQKFTIANLAQTIQLEVAAGYKIILEDMLVNNDTNKANMALTIYRIIQYYSIICLRSYQLYAKEPTTIWQELHILYKLAKKENVLEYMIDGVYSHQGLSTNIFTNYTSLLLLAALNPFQLRQNEQENISKIAETWTRHVVLRQYAKDDATKPGIFLIDLESDLPPTPTSLKKSAATKSCLSLDLAKLCGHLKKIAAILNTNEIQAKIAQPNVPEYILTNAVIQRLIYTISNLLIRKTKRFVIRGNAQALYGLSAVHSHIGEGKPFAPDDIKKDSPSFQEVNALELTEELPATDANVTDTASTDTASTDTASADSILNLTLDDSDKQYKILGKKDQGKFIIHDCGLLDISPTGACISWEIHNYPLPQPGEIIAINTNTLANSASAANSAIWDIGVIRWLKQLDENNIRIGIQLLAAYANAAGAQILKEDVPVCYFLRCLLLPKMEELSMNATIITPNLPFSQEKFVNLFTSSDEPIIKIQLTKLIDATSSYKQFEYTTEESLDIAKMIKENQANKQAIKETYLQQQRTQAINDITDKFKSIWDEI